MLVIVNFGCSQSSPKSKSKSNWDWADTIITWATTHNTHPPHPQLLTMKECSREKVLVGKKSQYDFP